jgi:hypothetical protein
MARLANPECSALASVLHRRRRRAGRFEFALKFGSNVRRVIGVEVCIPRSFETRFLALIH